MPMTDASKQLKRWTPLVKIQQMFICNERQHGHFDTWKTVVYKNRLYYSWDKTLTHSHSSLYLLSLSNWRDLSWTGMYKSECHLYINQNARLSYFTILGREKYLLLREKEADPQKDLPIHSASFLKEINKTFMDTSLILIYRSATIDNNTVSVLHLCLKLKMYR